jgi:sarcosine oxidase subunit gamma
VSERSVCLIVEGARAAEVIAAGCPLDLDRFALGRATRTVFETAEIILLRTGEDRFEVEVWRSFAPWLRTALETAAKQLR